MAEESPGAGTLSYRTHMCFSSVMAFLLVFVFETGDHFALCHRLLIAGYQVCGTTCNSGSGVWSTGLQECVNMHNWRCFSNIYYNLESTGNVSFPDTSFSCFLLDTYFFLFFVFCQMVPYFLFIEKTYKDCES